MAVFTELNLKNAQALCEKYGLTINKITPIAEGVTNSNYLIHDTEKKQYVLTVVEQICPMKLEPLLDVLTTLPDTVPHPRMIKTLIGHTAEIFNNKPIIICEFVKGGHLDKPSTTQITAIAKAMACLHQHDVPDFKRQNPRGLLWMQEISEIILPKLNVDELSLLENTLADINQVNFELLPKGIIHCDLFRDNTLYMHDKLMAIIDFYYACFDSLLFDIAISVNDWCFDKPELFLDAYQSVRPLTDIELEHFHLMRRVACVRFWLSRLYDLHFPVEGALVPVKDPGEMWDKLRMLGN